MEQTTINDYKVMIFHGYDGTQLFISDPSGNTIYAHRVSGDAIERAKEVIGRETESTLEVQTAQTERASTMNDKMICVSERKAEFVEALARGKDTEFEIYDDWDKDAFVIVNLKNKNEYRVHLESRDQKLYADCECGDFQFRRRTCKHIGEVLTHCLFSIAVKN